MRTKLTNPVIPNEEEKTFIRLIESYGKSEFGIKTTTLCKLIFMKELDNYTDRILRLYREKYQNYLYENVIPIGKIIARNGVYKLIDNEHALKEQMQYKALNDFLCSLIDLKNTERIYGKILLKGQVKLPIDELIKEVNEVLINERNMG